MPQDQKSIQQPKRDRRDYEQIHRRNAVSVIAQKGLPALRRWLPSPRHVFCHGGLPDIDAKLEQFAVDPRCFPKRVRGAHVANELANVRRCLWSATTWSGFPAPIGSETSAVPADHRLRLEDFQCVHTRRSILPNANRFGDLRRGTLSWCRRTRISASNAARELNSPIKAHQINLQRSLIWSEYQPIRSRSQRFWVCGRDTPRKHRPE